MRMKRNPWYYIWRVALSAVLIWEGVDLARNLSTDDPWWLFFWLVVELDLVVCLINKLFNHHFEFKTLRSYLRCFTLVDREALENRKLPMCGNLPVPYLAFVVMIILSLAIVSFIVTIDEPDGERMHELLSVLSNLLLYAIPILLVGGYLLYCFVPDEEGQESWMDKLLGKVRIIIENWRNSRL